MNDYEKLAQSIILHQEKIIGPLSWEVANNATNVSVKGKEVKISADGEKALVSLVAQYETLFGQASVESCKDAIRPVLNDVKVKLPDVLK